MSTKRRYKIINDTIKPKVLNSKGQDLRATRDKTGSAVQFYIGEGSNAKLYTIYQNKSTIIDELPESVLRLHKQGKVVIETINDITDELRNFSVKPEAAPVSADKNEVFKSNKVVSPYEPKSAQNVKAKASPSGTPAVEDKLVYPDGEPNFVAKAPQGGPKKKKVSAIEDESPVATEVSTEV